MTDTDKLTLQARIAELEAELAIQADRLEAVVADAQARSYWTDMLELDFAAITAHPAGRRALWVILKTRGAQRRLRWYRKRFRGS